MAEQAPRRSRGRPRGGKTGRPRRNADEMDDLRMAVITADLKGFTPEEAVAFLKSRGVEITPARYLEVRRQNKANAPALLARAGRRIQEIHLGAIANVREVRAEAWREYHRIRPPSDDADLTDNERHKASMDVSHQRNALYRTIMMAEPMITSYAEAASVRTSLEGHLGGGDGGAPLKPPPSPLPPAPNADPERPATRDDDDDDEQWHPAPDPERPGMLRLVPRAEAEALRRERRSK